MVSEVKESFAQVINLVKEEEGKSITTTEEVIAYLDQWSREDRKVTPLKTLQGFVWKKAYEDGDIKGHVYDDVPTCLNKIGRFQIMSTLALTILRCSGMYFFYGFGYLTLE